MSTAPSLIGTLESALYARDLETAAAFWTKVMGLRQIAFQPGRHVFFRCGAQVLLVFDPSATRLPPPSDARVPVPPHGCEGQGHFCIAVEAALMDDWKQHLEANAVTIESDFTWPQGGRSIYFRDPAGNSIELADPTIWAGLPQA